MNVKITTVLNWLSLIPTIMLIVTLGMDAMGIWNDFARNFSGDPAVPVGHLGLFIVWPVFVITLINLIIALCMKRFTAAFIALILLYLNFYVANAVVEVAR